MNQTIELKTQQIISNQRQQSNQRELSQEKVIQQSSSIDNNIKNLNQVKEEQILKKQEKQEKYGPFNLTQERKQNNVQNQMHLNITKNISLEPIVNISTKNKKLFKDKISVNVSLKFTEESERQQTNADIEDIEKKILELAKNIRQKAKNQDKKSLNISLEPDDVSKSRQKYSKTSTFLTPIKSFSKNQKNHSTFINNNKNYSKKGSENYPKIKQKNNLKQKQGPLKLLVQLNSIQDVDIQQQSFHNENEEKYQNLNKSQNSKMINSEQSSNKLMKRFLMQIVKKAVKLSQENQKLPKIKLNLDPRQHHYDITQFRKSILKQKKQIQMKQIQKQKEREQILSKRRQIFYNSRYHPVGIRLSNIRLSKLVKKQKQTSPKGQSQSTEIFLTDFQKHKPKINEQSFFKSGQNNSFNESQGLNPEIKQLKSQSQLYKDLNSLTKQFQNDSTPIQKMKKKQEQKTIFLLKTKEKKLQMQNQGKVLNYHQQISNQLNQHNNNDQEIFQNQNYNNYDQFQTNLQKQSSTSKDYNEKYYQQKEQYFQDSDNDNQYQYNK